MESTAAAAHQPTAVWTRESLDAFTSCCARSNSSNFPFSAACATQHTPVSPPSPPELDPDNYRTNAAEVPRKATAVKRQRLCTSCQPPRTARPIVLIHSPRELLAYRNARPPVYVHCRSCGDGPQSHNHRGSIRARCDNCSAFLSDYVTYAGYSSPSSKTSSPCTSDSQCRYLRRRRISLVPTMGGLHEGHLHLMRQAACLSDEVWVTVFLNPLQFQSSKDFFTYPASIDEDIRLIQQTGVVSVLFVPQREALFPLDPHPTVSFPAAKSPPSASSAHGVRAADMTACAGQRENTPPHTREAILQGGKSLETAPAAAAGRETAAAAGGDTASTASPPGSCEYSSETLTQGDAGKCLSTVVVAALQSVADGKASPATPASTTATTSRVEGGYATEKTNNCNSDRQESPNFNETSRPFRMRVFFTDIEDVDGEGKRRPGFFGGIGTVVTQLLTLTRPTYLHLGLKDFQQVVCLKRLVCGLGLDVLIVAHSTKRHASDGLSLSSRNQRLNRAERTAAAKYYSVLQEICRSYERGERRVERLESEARLHAAAAGLHLYYVTFNRWQDGVPAGYTRGSSCSRMMSSCYSAASTTTGGVPLASSSHLTAKLQDGTQQQDRTRRQELASGKEDSVVHMNAVQPGSGGEEEKMEVRQQPQEDPEGLGGWRMESPGKYCCTVAVRGNADATLVDNVTLTDQPQ